MTKLQKALNTIAIEMFRNQADQDYICARINYRMVFREQFLWSGLHAIEKYLKAILLFNGRNARYVDLNNKSLGVFGHNLTKLIKAINDIEVFSLIYPSWGNDFMKYLTEFGINRYFTKTSHLKGDEFFKLDKLIWSIRRYCQYLHKIYKSLDGGEIDGIDLELDKINNPNNERNPKGYKPFDGILEQILAKPQKDFTRKALIWRNNFYGKKGKIKNTDYPSWVSIGRSPIDRGWSITPRLKHQIKDYVKL